VLWLGLKFSQCQIIRVDSKDHSRGRPTIQYLDSRCIIISGNEFITKILWSW